MADGSALAVLLEDSEKMAKERAIKTNAEKGAFSDMEAIYRETGIQFAVFRMNPGQNRRLIRSVYVIPDIGCQAFCL